MWLGSMPSGVPEIVSLRRRLRGQIFGPGHAGEFRLASPLVAPGVSHDWFEHPPSAALVRVGEGRCAATLTPWSCPFTPADYRVEEARNLIHARVDAADWLARLNGKQLVCNCDLEMGQCWAYLLQNEFSNLVGDDVGTERLYTYDVAEEDHDPPQLMPFEAYITLHDELDGRAYEDSGIP